ncbi:CLUMA_CG003322, isoform A [Clunio marinus]|uniref:CLUMA_CG003322, isoform A n=1 Tax=Clunio marinus TaxID=568069 RepID=A0A1J1HQ62_9DIPT|nr:CLUMA_CG003322, isoform A [Clunio marinus]
MQYGWSMNVTTMRNEEKEEKNPFAVSSSDKQNLSSNLFRFWYANYQYHVNGQKPGLSFLP